MISEFKNQIGATPAFVIDEHGINDSIASLSELRADSGCKILYSMKALPLQSVIRLLADQLDGISVSSLFEARLAKEIMNDQGSIHLTSPGLKVEEFYEVSGLCSHISFNSLTQMERMTAVTKDYSIGLRINPKVSILKDRRYDPCRQYSKLGVDINELERVGLPGHVTGLHFHTAFSCKDLTLLLKTIDKIMPVLMQHFRAIHWLNLGGGYLFNQIDDREPFVRLIKELKRQYDLDVFIEPGKALVGHAGFLVSTVIDRFVSDSKTIVILDTSVNHHPEVFEYQSSPKLWQQPEGEYSVILAGTTCLAGDVFGEYRLAQVPEIGERLVFKDVGAYSLIKANRFNGYNLPEIYHLKEKRVVQLKKYDYQDYKQQWMVNE